MKICVVTGSRAEYGLLSPVMKELETYFKLQVVVTGAHLSKEYGYTVKEVEKDYRITDCVDMVLDDTVRGVTRSLGIGVIKFADTFDKLKPDIVVLLGDRYEIFAAAQAALIATIPIAHIAGGDTTEGAFDEAIRHSITKMSHIHFTTNEESARRVRQMGENPDYVFNVGSPGLDALKVMERKSLERELGFKLKDKNILVMFHPATLDDEDPAEQFMKILDAVGDGIFIAPNADTGRGGIADLLRGKERVFDSLPRDVFISLLAHVDVLVGNSSCGLYEAPTLKTPTVNIGDRQGGRLRASSVIDCGFDNIPEAIEKALMMDCSDVVNPYGCGDSSEKIVNILRGIDNPKGLIKKKFWGEIT